MLLDKTIQPERRKYLEMAAMNLRYHRKYLETVFQRKPRFKVCTYPVPNPTSLTTTYYEGKYFDAFANSAWIKYIDQGDGDRR